MLRQFLLPLTMFVIALAQAAGPAGKSCLLAAEVNTASSAVTKSDWPAWRGSLGNGHAASDSRPPTHFGTAADSDALAWQVPIAGRGHSSPIVVGSKVFLASADENGMKQFVICVDLETGKPLWKKMLSEGGFPRNNHAKNTEASTTIASDGQALWVTFFHHKKVELICLDLGGEVHWRKDVCVFNPQQFEYGYAPSPVLYDDLVIIAAEYDGPSMVAAFRKSDGEEVWRTAREPSISFSTPVVANVGGRDQLVMSGQQKVTSYDPATGKQLWQTEGTTFATCGTMVWHGDSVIASGGYPKAETIAILADGSSKVLWRNNHKCYEQSMILVDGFVYAFTDRGVMYCWNATDGTEMWRERLGGNVSASAVAAGGNIYWANEAGTMFVFKANPKRFELVAENRIGNSAFASPAISGNKLLLRVGHRNQGQYHETLYCFGR